jgi:hypothetical protein
MAITLNGDSGITTPTYGGTDTSEYLVPVTAFKNRIINGAMMFDQRNNGASVTPTSNSYTLDRWKTDASQASKFTVQQNAGSVTPPSGFKNYYGVTSSSAYTVGAAESFGVYQMIEGYNVADLGFGAAGASTITISFWVRSSLTGTFGGTLCNSAFNRSYPFSYTISSANTWEQKTVTVVGDTTGTWLTTNGIGLACYFSLGTGTTYSGTAGSWASGFYASATGATSVVGTSGATFYIGGVQLEKGSTATSFDYRAYGTEFDLCRRYCEVYSDNEITQQFAPIDVSNRPETVLQYYPKRVAPTITVASGTAFTWQTAANTYPAITSYGGTFVGTGIRAATLFFGVSSGVTVNTLSAVGIIAFNGTNSITISAEL